MLLKSLIQLNIFLPHRIFNDVLKNIFGLQNVTILNTISWDHSNSKISTNKYSNFINS